MSCHHYVEIGLLVVIVAELGVIAWLLDRLHQVRMVIDRLLALLREARKEP